MNDKNTQSFDLDVDGKEIGFTVTRDIFNKYTNEMNMTDKVAPSHNFLMRCVDDESKTDLKAHLTATPGSEIEIAGELAAAYKPDTKITVKPRKTAPSK